MRLFVTCVMVLAATAAHPAPALWTLIDEISEQLGVENTYSSIESLSFVVGACQTYVETVDPGRYRELWSEVVSEISLALTAFDMDYSFLADGERFAARAIIRDEPMGEDILSDLVLCQVQIDGTLARLVNQMDGLSYTPEVGH